MLDAFGDDPPPALSDGRLARRSSARVNEAVIAAKGIGSVHPSSNTVLLAPLVAGGELSWAAIGDGALVVARPGASAGASSTRRRCASSATR